MGKRNFFPGAFANGTNDGVAGCAVAKELGRVRFSDGSKRLLMLALTARGFDVTLKMLEFNEAGALVCCA